MCDPRFLPWLLVACLAGACATSTEKVPVKQVPVQPEQTAVKSYGVDQTEISGEPLAAESDFEVSNLDDLKGEVLLGSAADGTSVYLSSYSGEVVLVNYWSSACAPCRQVLDDLELLYQSGRDRGLVLVNVNTGDTGQAMQDFLAGTAQARAAGSLMDPSGRAAGAVGVLDVPTVIVYDGGGKEVVRYQQRIDVDRVRQDLGYILP